MSWCLVRPLDGVAVVKQHGLVDQYEVVVSRHETAREAREALRLYEDRRNHEEAIAAGQMDMFSEGGAK